MHGKFAGALVALELAKLMLSEDSGRVTVGVTDSSFAFATIGRCGYWRKQVFVVRHSEELSGSEKGHCGQNSQEGWHEDSSISTAKANDLLELRGFRVGHGAIGHDI